LFAAITHGSCWGDLKKPLDMLFDEKIEMWEEKQNECMNKGTQRTINHQFEMEIDNEGTGEREISSASENFDKDDQFWKCESNPNRIEWVSDTLIQAQHAKDEDPKKCN